MEQICRALQPDEITSVYEVWGSSHFPEDELKPLSSIKALLEQKQYSGYGLFSQESETEYEEGESLLGYACLLYTSLSLSFLISSAYSVNSSSSSPIKSYS